MLVVDPVIHPQTPEQAKPNQTKPNKPRLGSKARAKRRDERRTLGRRSVQQKNRESPSGKRRERHGMAWQVSQSSHIHF